MHGGAPQERAAAAEDPAATHEDMAQEPADAPPEQEGSRRLDEGSDLPV
jgi:hypothetical protein